MKEIRITDKFSFAGMAILIVSEDIPMESGLVIKPR